MPKSAEYVTALLACWMAGAAFVPVDPGLPAERRRFILRTADPKVLIAAHEDPDAASLAIPVSCARPHPIPRLRAREGLEAEVDRTQTIPPSRLAYVFFTSGSTGEPKGVMVEHRGLLPMLDRQIEVFGLGIGKRVLFLLSTMFDASVSDIGTALLSGATLVIASEHRLRPLSMLTETLRTERITHVDIAPSLLAALDAECTLPDLECAVVGGEPMPADAARAWSQRLRLVNVYGPTEATVCASLCLIGPDWERPLIGDPIPGTSCAVIDSEGRSSSRGELLILGDGLARGYLKQPELTGARFIRFGADRAYRTGDLVEIDSHGRLVFLGRTDRQIKIRGQLVAPEETEAHLAQLPGVARAAVIPRRGPRGQTQLIGFVQAKPENSVSEMAAQAATCRQCACLSNPKADHRVAASARDRQRKARSPGPRYDSAAAGRPT